MNLTIFTDGGSLNNPGQAAYAFLVFDGEKLIHKQAERIGIASNNVAEYTALIKALEYVRDCLLPSDEGVSHVHVISDSLLMVKQVVGEYKVKNTDIKVLHTRVKMLEMELGIPLSFEHVLREKNTQADALVKEALAHA